jgi:hypothetical protein
MFHYGHCCLRVPAKQISDFPLLILVTSQDLALHQSASRLQTASADLWTFSINMTSPLRILFICLIYEVHGFSHVINMLTVLF